MRASVESMNAFDPQLLSDYHKSRTIENPSKLCYAPFNSMYFNTLGQASACWLTLHGADRYPEKSIAEIWRGQAYQELRDKIQSNLLSDRCHVCERNIRNRIFDKPLAKIYDLPTQGGDYPQIMEFEVSNFCNLECVMCKGTLSSSIRKNRDKLPPIELPYGDRFVEELVEFLPHLKEARFYGGEPFLQEPCWKIWEKIAEVNPKIEITVATNGTVLTDRVKDILERCRFRVNVSFDSVNRKNYEAIRKNAKFDRGLKHIDYFSAYARRIGTVFSIMVNPMRNNWEEMPEFVEFCADRGARLWFNTVWRPANLALWSLPSSELDRIYTALSSYTFSKQRMAEDRLYYDNVQVFKTLLEGQIKSWREEQITREAESRDRETLRKTRERAKEKFFENLASAEVSPLERQKLMTKISELEERVSGNISSNDFYFYLSKVFVGQVIEDLRTKSLEHLTEWVYVHDGYY